MDEVNYAPDLSEFRLAKNQSEVMLSSYVKILSEHDRQVKAEGKPKELREKFLQAITPPGSFPDYDMFYKRLHSLIQIQKVYIK